MVVGNTGVLLTVHNLKTTTADNEPHYTNPFSTADILFTISSIICALFTAEVVIRLIITGRLVIRLPIDIIDATVVFAIFGVIVWCCIVKPHPFISDVTLLAVYLRLVRLPRLCCGLTSLESIQYRATVAHYQQDESFRQHNLNSMQHRLDINELELQELRQYVYANRSLVPLDCLSHDYGTNSETVDSDQFYRLHNDLQDLRCCPLNEEPDKESGSAEFGEDNLAFNLTCEEKDEDRVQTWIENCIQDTKCDSLPSNVDN
ncbi:hypothetical transcript [Echinococcus multilocularis]|uniref:Hypothetical transcript n=1 Tax=Echinococcus multilocularis TaxID=6211 RepID=A0A068Y097_ECHMU|nr:hypothetical transcript [Echinococcus multilocularis]